MDTKRLRKLLKKIKPTGHKHLGEDSVFHCDACLNQFDVENDIRDAAAIALPELLNYVEELEIRIASLESERNSN